MASVRDVHLLRRPSCLGGVGGSVWDRRERVMDRVREGAHARTGAGVLPPDRGLLDFTMQDWIVEHTHTRTLLPYFAGVFRPW